MARLPQPGADSGTWGNVLNDYLSQTLKSDGTLKDNTVTSSVIAPNAITSAKIATDAVGATQIADASITETLLDTAVQTKLNQAAPTWSTLSGKPSVIAAGVDQAAARTAIDSDQLGYPAYSANRDGVTNDSTILTTASAAAVTAGRPLVLLAGVHYVTSSVTINSPVSFLPGAIIKPASGITVTLLGGVVNTGNRQLFDHSVGGLVVPQNVDFYRPGWWGPIGTSNDSQSWIDMAASLTASSVTLYGGAVFGQKVLAPSGINLITGVTLSNCEVIAGRGAVSFAPPNGTTTGVVLTLGDFAQLNGGWFGTTESTQAVTLVWQKGYRAQVDGVYIANKAANSIGLVAGDSGLPSTSPVINSVRINSGQTTPTSGSIGLDIQSPDLEATNVWVAQHDIGVRGSKAGAARIVNMHVWGNNTGISGNQWDKSQVTQLYLDSNRGWGVNIDQMDFAVWSGILCWNNGAAIASTGGMQFLQSSGAARASIIRGLILDDNTGTGLLVDGPDDYVVEATLRSSAVKAGGAIVTAIGVQTTSATLSLRLKLYGADATTPLVDAGSGTVVITDPQSTDGLTMGGLLSTKATTSTVAGLRLPHGTAPTSPTDGDLWTRSDGLFVRINGTTRAVVRRISQTVTVNTTLSSGGDYLVQIAAAVVTTLPTSSGNIGTYTLKNNTAAAVTVASTSSQTFDGAAGPLSIAARSSVTLMSDGGTNWLSIAAGRPSVINVKEFGALGDGSTNDTTAINAAITALAAGDTLYFPPGRYMTNGGHTISQPSCVVRGSSGRAQTYNSSVQLYLLAGSNVDMLTIAANQVTVRDLSLYGNGTNQTGTSRGVVTPSTSAANYLLLDAVWVDSFNGDGFSFESSGGTLSSTIVNCESRVNIGYGMRFYGTSTDSMVSNCYIDQNVQSGVHSASGDLSLTSCHIWGNGTGGSGDRDGITFQSSAGCRVVNCYVEGNHQGAGIRFKTGTNKGHIVSECDIWDNGTQGIYAYSASNCVFSNNVIRTNNYISGSGSSGAGVVVDTCTAMTITGNQFFSVGANRQTYGYYESGSSNVDIRFSDNMCRAADHSTGGVFLGPGTRADLGSVFTRKTTDQSVTSSNTLVNDSDLSFAVAIGEVWEIEGLLFVDAATTGDILIRLTAPASPTGYWRALGGAVSNASSTAASFTPAAQLFNVNMSNGGLGAGVIAPVKLEGMVTIATAGNVTLQWAQNTSDATATTVKAGSYLRARRVAQ